MTHKLGKFSTLTLGVLVVTGSFAIAAGPQDQKSSQSSQTKSGYSSQQQEQSGSQKSQMQSSGTPVMGSRASTIVFATVNEVNKEQNTVTLQASDGSMMEMDVPEETLSNLQQGDIVEVTVDKLTAVTIDKVHDAQQSAMSGKTQGSQQSSQQGSQQSSDSGTSAQGSQSPTTTPATVEAIDSQQGKITLRMEKSGKTVDMQVPEELLSDLESGDSVQVSIRKSQQSQSGGSQSPNSKSQSR